ncbi:MAG TPA: protoporphyrinogen oxidase [Terriglobia bacterium]|nr:protoporphyrinogen oxidase [Terriglobia bacterium]
MTRPRRIAVLGGGITGLAATYTLAKARQAGAPIEEQLIEASHRLGGHLRTERVEGYVVEAGPDSFLAEKPEAAALCRELGLGGQLIGSNDAERRTYILHHGRLVPLPDGLMFLVPTRLWPTFWTPLLSFRSKAAIVTEVFTPRPGSRRKDATESANRLLTSAIGEADTAGLTPGATFESDDVVVDDESVADFVRRHFGDSMLENIADPLLAGVYGGDAAGLSIRAVLPRFWQMEQKHGSLVRAVLAARRQRRTAPSPDSSSPSAARSRSTTSRQSLPLFMTLRDGLGQLVDALAARLDPGRVHLGQRVVSLGRGVPAEAPEGSAGPLSPTRQRYVIGCEGGAAFAADAVILALPTYTCGRLLVPFDEPLAQMLGGIPYTAALTVALGYDSADLAGLPPGFGFLVPYKEQRRMLACTFVHNKFPGRVASGKGLLRCFLGGARDSSILDSDNTSIINVIRSELHEVLNLRAEPEFFRVYRWPSSMPQYSVGHTQRVKLIQSRVEGISALFLAGNAYSGIGISDCVRTGRAAAERALGAS